MVGGLFKDTVNNPAKKIYPMSHPKSTQRQTTGEL